MEERILILAPSGKDAQSVAVALDRAGLAEFACSDLVDLCAELDRGAGAALVAEEALRDGRCLIDWLERQPAWSDFPILLAAASRGTGLRRLRPLGPLGNVVLLERPLRSVTLVTAAQSALRARRRQYQVRDHLRERERAAAALRSLNETLEQRVHERTHALEQANRRLIAETEERKQIEAVLRQAQKIEAVGQLTGGVAHDFNNLLTAVLGNLEFIGMRSRDEATQKLVQTAVRAAERGAQLTQQLLAFARKQHLQPKPVNVNDVVGGMGGMLARTIGTTIRIEQMLDTELWPALVDPNQLELVILNLAINARDAMPVSGKLSIETANVAAGDPARAPDLPPGDLIRVSVRDTGTGMSEDVLAKAFEPFFTTKEVGRGSGLGLSQVYGVAKQSGGDVRIRSGLGQGTTVEVYFPRARTAALDQAKETAAAQNIPGGSELVLVVDDDRDVRELITLSLGSLGYRTLEAANGRAALEILDKVETVDCLLVDYAMPGMTGADVARVARERRPSLPILFTTGYADMQALHMQVQDAPLLKKPFKVAELAERIQMVLRRGEVQPAGASNVLPLRPHGR
ncbi:MAG TPA: response regulator [Stellaceae bacterium]